MKQSTSVTIAVIALMQMFAACAVSAAVPATRPSVAVPKESAEHLMLARFSLLTRRSMFVKGSQFVIDRTPGAYVPSRDRGGRSFPTTVPSGAATQPAALAANVVFNGVIMVDGNAAAMVEDINASRIWTVQIGDRLADGKVVGITLDTMEYQANGKIVRVEIGHNMQGAVAGPATTQPGQPGTGGDDIVERMRKRRQQELGN